MKRMKRMVGPAFLPLVLLACAPVSEKKNAPSEKPFSGIVGGESVKQDDPVRRSTVALLITAKPGAPGAPVGPNGETAKGLCTGALIVPGIVLTAAHCLDDAKSVEIIFADTVAGAAKANIKKASKWEQHPWWREAKRKAKPNPASASDQQARVPEETLFKGRGDIALVRFKGNAPTGYEITKPLLAGQSIGMGTQVIIAGYGLAKGLQDGDQVGDGVLRSTTVEVVGASSRTEVVLEGKESGTCFGDSGGPAFLKTDGKIYLWGIASAVSSLTCTEMMVHTDVLSHGHWLVDTARRLLR